MGYGEIDDGAFPSLAIGATSLIFEDLWSASRDLTLDEAHDTLKCVLGENSLWMRYWRKALPGASGGKSAKLVIDKLAY